MCDWMTEHDDITLQEDFVALSMDGSNPSRAATTASSCVAVPLFCRMLLHNVVMLLSSFSKMRGVCLIAYLASLSLGFALQVPS
jgi:hypothetical protein